MITRKRTALAGLILSLIPVYAQAEIDGHGPDSWRVTGVAANDALNARMGPGSNFPVIEAFAHNERGMKQVTCTPYYTLAHYSAMTPEQIKELPPRWCLMRNKTLSKAGWVAQRYITPDGEDQTNNATTATADAAPEPYATNKPDADLVAMAQDLVRELYERQFQSENSKLAGPFDASTARNYFTDDIVAWLAAGKPGGHPLYGAQDFDGAVEDPEPDAHNPMLRGMITINVNFTNFGKKQRAVFYLRPDTSRPDAPLRIFRVEHDGWAYP